MNSLIKQYINKITINNINDFAIKNNIILSKKELDIFYDIIKNHYENILSNEKDIKNYLKQNITKENYEKVIPLYESYKEKYSNYLM